MSQVVWPGTPKGLTDYHDVDGAAFLSQKFTYFVCYVAQMGPDKDGGFWSLLVDPNSHSQLNYSLPDKRHVPSEEGYYRKSHHIRIDISGHQTVWAEFSLCENKTPEDRVLYKSIAAEERFYPLDLFTTITDQLHFSVKDICSNRVPDPVQIASVLIEARKLDI